MSKATLSNNEFNQIKGKYDEEAVRSHSINTRCYLDSKFLQIEREQVFHRSWQFVCHEEKLREPNSYIAIEVQGQSVVAIRNKAGKLKAFYNVCKHRGHEHAGIQFGALHGRHRRQRHERARGASLYLLE